MSRIKEFLKRGIEEIADEGEKIGLCGHLEPIMENKVPEVGSVHLFNH